MLLQLRTLLAVLRCTTTSTYPGTGLRTDHVCGAANATSTEKELGRGMGPNNMKRAEEQRPKEKRKKKRKKKEKKKEIYSHMEYTESIDSMELTWSNPHVDR